MECCAWRPRTRAKGTHLGEPLLLDVLKRGGTGDAEADEEDVRLRVRERPQAVVVLLSGRVEQAERVRVVSNHDRNRLDRTGVSDWEWAIDVCPHWGMRGGGGVRTYIVVEHGRHVLGRELVGRVRDQEAGLAERETVSLGVDASSAREGDAGWAVIAPVRMSWRTFPTAPSPTTCTERAKR